MYSIWMQMYLSLCNMANTIFYKHDLAVFVLCMYYTDEFFFCFGLCICIIVRLTQFLVFIKFDIKEFFYKNGTVLISSIQQFITFSIHCF